MFYVFFQEKLNIFFEKSVVIIFFETLFLTQIIFFVSDQLKLYRIALFFLAFCCLIIAFYSMIMLQFFMIRFLRFFPLFTENLHKINNIFFMEQKDIFLFFKGMNLVPFLEMIYNSFSLTLIIPSLILPLQKRLWERLDIYAFSLYLSCFMCILIGTLTLGLSSCYGPGESYWISDSVILEIRQASAFYIKSPFLGAISFPSFHFIPILLYTWACWPVFNLRIVGFICTGLMILATTVVGCHYFIDILGGLAVAFFSLYVSRRVNRSMIWGIKNREFPEKEIRIPMGP